MHPLSSESQRQLAESQRRRVDNEMGAIAAIASANPDRLQIGGLLYGAGAVFGFGLFFDVKTSIAPAPGELPRQAELPIRQRVEARFVLDHYPEGPPTIGLLSERPLFLPAVLGIDAVVEGRYPALVCTFRGPFSRLRHDLPFFVLQVFRALVCDPAVLNAPHDALNPAAARWFLERHDSLSLPFEPDLAVPGPPPAAPAPAFKLERLP
jgi:hypothetical protein